MTESPDAEFGLTCARCGASFELSPLVTGCPACAREGILSVPEICHRPRAKPLAPSLRRGPQGLRRYADLLPGGPHAARISLGEGSTPLVRSRIIGPRLGLKHLYFKNEAANPTWSFKDRYVAVTISVARTFGFRRAVVSSTGNLGVSAAAYCAAAGIDCLFLAPPDTAAVILHQARLHGAHLLITTWDGRLPIFEHLALERGWFPIGLFLPRRVSNPFGIEGYKTIAYEILEELGTAPAAVLFPCARGNGLFGTWKGFREAQAYGWSSAVPAMVACQPVGANSLQVSIRTGASQPVELPSVESVCTSTKETIADGRALDAIRSSEGDALSADDAAVLRAVADLGREGLCVETSSALPVACLPELKARRALSADDIVVCVLTSAGVKWPEQMASGEPLPSVLPATREAVDRYLTELGVGS